jgi:hypothetical protein
MDADHATAVRIKSELSYSLSCCRIFFERLYVVVPMVLFIAHFEELDPIPSLMAPHGHPHGPGMVWLGRGIPVFHQLCFVGRYPDIEGHSDEWFGAERPAVFDILIQAKGERETVRRSSFKKEGSLLVDRRTEVETFEGERDKIIMAAFRILASYSATASIIIASFDEFPNHCIILSIR